MVTQIKSLNKNPVASISFLNIEVLQVQESTLFHVVAEVDHCDATGRLLASAAVNVVNPSRRPVHTIV